MADRDTPEASTLGVRLCDGGADARDARLPPIYRERHVRAGGRGREPGCEPGREPGCEIDLRFVMSRRPVTARRRGVALASLRRRGG